MQTSEEVETYKKYFSEKCSLLEDVCCVVDGLKIHLEQSGDYVIQNMLYNGFNHDKYV